MYEKEAKELVASLEQKKDVTFLLYDALKDIRLLYRDNDEPDITKKAKVLNKVNHALDNYEKASGIKKPWYARS
jgi:hypothetical protein